MIPKLTFDDGPELLDGGMGQELYARIGGDVGTLWSGEVLINEPSLVRDVHEDFIQAGAQISAFLVNCCSPESVSAAIPELVSLGDCPVGGLANGFVEVPADWVSSDGIKALGRREDINEISYVSHVKNWLASGARIVGGCCEIGPKDIAHVRKMLDEHWFSPTSRQNIRVIN